MSERGFTTTEWIDRNGGGLRDRIQPKTVPLLILTNPESPKVENRLSGVLVGLGPRHFVLTAGHCVEKCIDKRNRVVIPVVDWPAEDAYRLSPVLKPDFLNSNLINVDPGTVDYGYLEFHPQSASTLGAKRYEFNTRISPWKAPEFHGADSWVAVAGYPIDIAQTTEGSDQSRFMITPTLVAREEELAGVGELPEGFDVLDLLLPQDALESPDGLAFVPAEPTSHHGVSGGGCWTLDVSKDVASWTDQDRPSLCAIHAGHTEEADGNQILREVPISYHLRMIADDYPDLASDLYERWPQLAAVAPADSFR